jgi:hypothetical protein
MKLFFNTLLILSLLLLTASAKSNENTESLTETKLTSAMGYPYKLLITRTESIKIIYSEDEHGVKCKVKVLWQAQAVQSQPQQVSKKKFSEKPLASCLPRQKAKAILAMTFQ